VGEDEHGARVYERRRPRRGGAVVRLGTCLVQRATSCRAPSSRGRPGPAPPRRRRAR
jgi:hypothetical protein